MFRVTAKSLGGLNLEGVAGTWAVHWHAGELAFAGWRGSRDKAVISSLWQCPNAVILIYSYIHLCIYALHPKYS